MIALLLATALAGVGPQPKASVLDLKGREVFCMPIALFSALGDGVQIFNSMLGDSELIAEVRPVAIHPEGRVKICSKLTNAEGGMKACPQGWAESYVVGSVNFVVDTAIKGTTASRIIIAPARDSNPLTLDPVLTPGASSYAGPSGGPAATDLFSGKCDTYPPLPPPRFGVVHLQTGEHYLLHINKIEGEDKRAGFIWLDQKSRREILPRLVKVFKTK